MSLRAYCFVRSLKIKPASVKSVAEVLADYATDRWISYPRMETFVAESGLTKSAVLNALKQLEASKLIRFTGQMIGDKRDVAVYELNPKDEPLFNQPKEKKKPNDEMTLAAEQIYQIYPRKVGKPKAIAAIIRSITECGFETVKAGTELFAKAWKESARTDIQFVAHPSTWFSQQRFNDDPNAWGLSVKSDKPVSLGPKWKEVEFYAKEKWGDQWRWMVWASNFYRHWADPKRNWSRNGKLIDWKEELTKQVGIWRQPEQTTNKTQSNL